jgi:hypothetical protein
MSGMRRLALLAVVVAGSVYALAGCGYALTGKLNTLPAGIRRIGIPTFQNLSTTPELDRLFTEAVRAEFQARGKFLIVPETTDVDAVLSGSIRSVNLTVTAFTADTRQALRYAVGVLASAEFKQTKVDKPLWASASLRVSDEYDAPNNVAVGDLSSLFAQDQNALERLAKTFAQKLVSTILENF